MASFRRIIDSGVKTQGEQVAPQSSLLGDLANVAAQGFAVKQKVDKEKEEKAQEQYVLERTDHLLDKASELNNQKQWGEGKVNKWLESQIRNEPPHVQQQVLKSVATQRSLGGLTLKKTGEDFLVEMEQKNFEQGLAILQHRGLSAEELQKMGQGDLKKEALRVNREAQVLQQNQQALEVAKAKALEEKEQGVETVLRNISEYKSKASIMFNSSAGAILSSAGIPDDPESAIRLLNDSLAKAKVIRSERASEFDGFMSGLLPEDREGAEKLKADFLKDVDNTIAQWEELKKQPLADLKNHIEMQKLNFLADKPVLIKTSVVGDALKMLDYPDVKPLRDIIQEIVLDANMSTQVKQRLVDGLGDGELTQQEFMASMEGLDQEQIGQISLKMSETYFDAVKRGSKDAINPAKATFNTLLKVISTDSSQAPLLLPKVMEVRPHLYKHMEQTEKDYFNFVLTDSIRGTVGDPQTGVLADISKDPAIRRLENAGLSKSDIFLFEGGKVTTNPKVREVIEQVGEGVTETIGGLGRGQGLQPMQQLLEMEAFARKIDKAASDMNSYVSEASTLDARAFEGMTKEQVYSYLTSSSTGNSLSDFSNVPSNMVSSDEMREALSEGKTTEEVREEKTLAEQRNALTLASREAHSVPLNKPDEMLSKAEELESKYKDKIPAPQLRMITEGLRVIARQEKAEQTADANIQRADQAETVEGRPSSQKATRDVPKEVAEDKEFLSETTSVAKRIGAKEEDLLRIIDFETGGTFDPAQENNAGGSAIGLIQFMPDVIKELGTTREEISGMTRTEQMRLVGDYLESRLNGIANPTISDLYMAVLRPKSVGKPEDSTVYKKGSSFYESNKGLDTNNDGKITKAEATQKVLDNTAMTDLKSLLQEANTPEERNQVLIDANIVSPD